MTPQGKPLPCYHEDLRIGFEDLVQLKLVMKTPGVMETPSALNTRTHTIPPENEATCARRRRSRSSPPLEALPWASAAARARSSPGGGSPRADNPRNRPAWREENTADAWRAVAFFFVKNHISESMARVFLCRDLFQKADLFVEMCLFWGDPLGSRERASHPIGRVPHMFFGWATGSTLTHGFDSGAIH